MDVICARAVDLAERTTGGLHSFVAERLRQLVSNRNACLLDVGCGTGSLIAKLQGLGFQKLLGLDIKPPSNLPGIDFLQCDLDNCKTSLESGSIDLAIAVEVFEHVENIGGLLQEPSRLLGATGMLLLTTPNVHSLEARIRFLLTGHLKQFDSIGDPPHITPIFRFPFERILKRHGFVVIQTWGHPEDGSSRTSRRSLRLLAQAACWLGLKGEPAGDTLFMLLGRTADWDQSGNPELKSDYLTARY
ncbi:MAG: class I SAM-dependent methyltransferase [Cyanobacteriota bacterium]